MGIGMEGGRPCPCPLGSLASAARVLRRRESRIPIRHHPQSSSCHVRFKKPLPYITLASLPTLGTAIRHMAISHLPTALGLHHAALAQLGALP